MRSLAAPSNVPLEFVTWVACFFIFRILQRRLCRRYPGILTVCRLLYVSTALVAVAPAVWALASGLHDARLLALVNRAFGMGVFAQTSLRSLLILKWLPLGGGPAASMAGEVPLLNLRTEAELLGMLMALNAALRPGEKKTGTSPAK
jgi:hypothetical protein